MCTLLLFVGEMVGLYASVSIPLCVTRQRTHRILIFGWIVHQRRRQALPLVDEHASDADDASPP